MKTKRPGSYTTEEVARLLQVSPDSVRRMRREGKITPLDLGLRSVRYSQRQIDRLVEQGTVERETVESR